MCDNLYSNDILDSESSSTDYMKLLERMDRIDKALRHKHKKHKKRKKASSKNKKLKKRLKALEKQNEVIANSVQMLAAIQMQQKKGTPWWQGTIENSTPKLIELASDVVKSRSQPPAQVLPGSSQLYLTDGRKKK